ncbi:MAG: phosphoglycerate kinase [bacterium]|nr:phosphoglycerate kinase [bacterium]
MRALGPLRGARVLCRIDANVPMDGTRVMDDTKLTLTLPTIQYLRREGAAVVLLSHLGSGRPRETLAPAAERLSTLLGTTVRLLRGRIGTTALITALAELKPREVVMLENLRRYRGEQDNDPTFARAIAALGTHYIFDAFGVAHRSHASVVGVPALLPSAAGALVEREMEAMERLRDGASPFVALLGGAKITTKAPAIARILTVADRVLLGGALATQFFVERGYEVGDSLVEAEGVAIAANLRKSKRFRNVMLPLDVVVGDPRIGARSAHVVLVQSQPHRIATGREQVLDIGPQTIRAYAEQLKAAKTILWNGPLGMFEEEPYHHGSIILARVVASRASGRAFGVVGGGETLAVLARTRMERFIDHISSGGGAMLAYLAADGKIPGILALRQSARVRA